MNKKYPARRKKCTTGQVLSVEHFTFKRCCATFLLLLSSSTYNNQFFLLLQVLLRQEHHLEDSREAVRLPLRVRPPGLVGLQPRGNSPNGRSQAGEEGGGLDSRVAPTFSRQEFQMDLIVESENKSSSRSNPRTRTWCLSVRLCACHSICVLPYDSSLIKKKKSSRAD